MLCTVIFQMIAGLRKAFNSGVTKTYEWRKKQLEGVLTLLDENRDRIAQCLKDDLNKVQNSDEEHAHDS